jgi:nitrite reductase (NO-forming)
MRTSYLLRILFLLMAAMSLFACAPQPEDTVSAAPASDQAGYPETTEVEFTLKTIAENGKLLYIGVGGEIDGVVNPDLVVQPGAVIRIVLINGDGMVHDLFLPDFDVKTDYVKRIGDQQEILFEAGDMQPGPYVYYCTLPGHRKAGQEGKLIITNP